MNIENIRQYLKYIPVNSLHTRSDQRFKQGNFIQAILFHFIQAITVSRTQLSIFTPGLGNSARNLLCLASGSIFTVTRTLVSGKICDAMVMDFGYRKGYAVDP
jgi:hypothetical protein